MTYHMRVMKQKGRIIREENFDPNTSPHAILEAYHREEGSIIALKSTEGRRLKGLPSLAIIP